MTGGNKFIKL